MDTNVMWVNEGFVLNDAGHLIQTSYVDLRDPSDRTSPITSIVRGSERKYALEDAETILISKPARFREFGEELIRDRQEGLAKEESLTVKEETARQQAVSDVNEAIELLKTRVRASYRETRTNTDRNSQSLSFGNEWWILCAAIRPSEEDWATWRDTLPAEYDHISEIGQPAKFAQALARMVAEQIGPKGQEGLLRDTTEGAETEPTKHRTQWVLHGPVVYVDSVYDALEAITDNRTRLAASVFTKSKQYAAQREYRFAVLNEGAEEETVVLQVSGMMRDSLECSEHGLVRTPPVPLSTDASRGSQSLQEKEESRTLRGKRTMRRERSTEREERRWETKGPEGKVLSSESDVRESVKERIVTENQQEAEDGFLTTTRTDRDEYEVLPAAQNLNMGDGDEKAVREIAQDEFDWDDGQDEGDQPPIQVRTRTGRVYKSFEEMWTDPTSPTAPFAEIWKEKVMTAEEIAKTYRAIEVLDFKMTNIEEQFRQDIASAGWYAMMCIRNIYARLGDIVDSVWIERKRFVVIRLKDPDGTNAAGRIVISPSGAYAYSIHLPNGEQNLGYGGLEWGTSVFPIGTTVETFERYGWPKKVI